MGCDGRLGWRDDVGPVSWGPAMINLLESSSGSMPHLAGDDDECLALS